MSTNLGTDGRRSTLEKDLAADELEDFDLDGCDEDRFSDLTRLQATGEYLITSKAFANYRQRLRQFLNPDLNKEPKMQVSVPRRHDLENSPGALTSVEEGQCAKDFRVLGRTECLDMSSETYEERARDASPSSNATQRQFPEADARDVYLERDSALVWFKKAFTDAIWPTIDGSQRIWYQCVSALILKRGTSTDTVLVIRRAAESTPIST